MCRFRKNFKSGFAFEKFFLPILIIPLFLILFFQIASAASMDKAKTVIEPLKVNLSSEKVKVGETATLYVSGGKPPYTVNSGSRAVGVIQVNNNTFRISGNTAGFFNLTVKDSSGNVQTKALTISDVKKPAMPLKAEVSSERMKAGGSVTVNVSGGKPPYKVSSTNRKAIITSIGTGTFRISLDALGGAIGGIENVLLNILDSEGASIIRNLVFEGGGMGITAPLRISLSAEKVNMGESVTLKVDGGMPPYKVTSPSGKVAVIAVSGNTFKVTFNTFGTVPINVYDSKGNTAAKSVTVGGKAVPLEISFSTIAIDVGGSGEFKIFGGTPPYYAGASSNIVSIVQTDNNRFRFTGNKDGVVVITVKDSTGSSANGKVTVKGKAQEPLQASLSSDVINNVGETAFLKIFGGVPPYHVISANAVARVEQTGANTFKITGVIAGNTTLRVYDNKGNSVTKDLKVGKKDALVQVTLSPETIGVGETATLTISGGTQPYSMAYQSDIVRISKTSPATYRITGVGPGVAMLTVRDSAGNLTNKKITVKKGKEQPIQAALFPEKPNAGEAATLTINGGVPPYSVSSTSSGVTINQIGNNSFRISRNVHGDTTITVRDSKGEILTKRFTVGGKEVPKLDARLSPDYLNDVGQSAVLTISGGVPPYNVSSSTDVAKIEKTGENTFKATALKSGSTMLGVRDSKGSLVNRMLQIRYKPVEPFNAKISAEKISVGEKATVSMSGGVPPYYMNVSPDRGMNFSKKYINSYELSPSQPGNYIITPKDSKGASRSLRLQVMPKAVPLNVSLSSETLDVGKTIFLTVRGGSPGYNVTASNNIVTILRSGGSADSVTYQIKGNTAGSTTLTIRDSRGGSATKHITVKGGQPLQISLSSEEVSVGGQVTITARGGIPPYSYSYSANLINIVPSGSNTFRVTAKAHGRTIIYIRDRSNNSVSKTLTIKEAKKVEPLTVIMPEVLSLKLGLKGNITIRGGYPPYSVTANNDVVSIHRNGDIFQILGNKDGVSTLTVRDSKGASSTRKVTVKTRE